VLTVTKTGNGTVTSGDGYINCGSSCSHTYLSGSVVKLTATPSDGWAFASWSGCDESNVNVCVVTMNSNRTVTATFKVLYPLTVSKTGKGVIVSGDGHIYCGTACSYSYIDGSQVGLTAVPSAGDTFSSWTGCDRPQGDFCTMVMSGAKSVTGNFTTSNIGLTSLVLDPNTVKGGEISIATISLSAPAPPGGLSIGVATNSPLAVHPPSLVQIPGGRTSFSFAVRTSVVRKKTVANVIASSGMSQATAVLTVTTGYDSPQDQSEPQR